MRKFMSVLSAMLLAVGGGTVVAIGGANSAAGAHAGESGHEHPENCADATVKTTDECTIYASGSKTFQGGSQKHEGLYPNGSFIQRFELPSNVAPEAVFSIRPPSGNPGAVGEIYNMVTANMDITAPELQQHRVFYDRTHFTKRDSDGTVALDSNGQVQSGQSIHAVLGSGQAVVDKLVANTWIVGEVDDNEILVSLNDGMLCDAAKWEIEGIDWTYFGWFWGRYPDGSSDPGVVRTCIQAVVKLRVQYAPNDSEYVSLRVKDNQNGPDSVFGEHGPTPQLPSAYPNVPPTGSAPSSADAAPLTVRLASERRWVSEDNGETKFTVSLSRPLQAGESAVVPLRVTGSQIYRDWNIRFRGRDSGPGVKRTAVGSRTELTFTEGGQTATLVLIGRPRADTADRTVRIAFGKGQRAPSATGVDGGIETANKRIKIEIRDQDG